MEDEELTHLGQSLGEIDKFEDVQLSDDEDDVMDKTEEGENYKLCQSVVVLTSDYGLSLVYW